MTAETKAPQVGTIIVPTPEPEQKHDERRCHLANEEVDSLCGDHSGSWLNMNISWHREVYEKLGADPVCVCGQQRCQKCITLYEAFKGVSW